MAKYKIAWLPGDGVGNDVMEAAKIVLEKIDFDAEYIHGDIGWEFWKTEADPLPERTVALLKKTDCALFGAITSRPKEEAEQDLVAGLRGKGHVYSSPIVRLRQEFNLRTNLRPCRAYPGNPLNYKEGIDIVVFRENTEDLYSGVEFHPLPDEVREVIKRHNKKMARFDSSPAEDIAVSLRINTRRGCRNIITDAFEYARKHARKSVTVVEKPNVIRETSGLMVRTAREIARDYPGIELWETNIDAMCMWLVKNPMDYSVLVTSNMFGDIVSDLCAQLVGGLGFAASGNIGDDYAVFEPTHGSAPKYAGQYKVNPMAMLISVKLMFDWLGEEERAQSLESAIAAVIQEGKVRTYDMGGANTSLDVARAVATRL
ncbi:MAG: isocitrate/isopropylmalate dehydrogenase family protein [candidate division Zixibacteria bacterium]|nr:isocitrate/isopropylmalate dehydrogenase family protein [candidate division Zixibacteria bacterium]